ncbi:transcriptional regulator, TetR family protein [Minicystis rosea]|nr:transcriptional regulator, TetR family protein [Minicystis rosea]
MKDNEARAKQTKASALLRMIDQAGPTTAEMNPQEAHILKCAMHSFAESGYAATSVRTIASAAGVTAPTINYYFGSKEGLYQRLVTLVTSALGEVLDSASSKSGPFEARLMALLGAVIDFAVTSPYAAAFMLDALYGSRAGRPGVDVDELERIAHGAVGQLIANAVKSDELMLQQGCRVEDLQRMCVMVMEHVIGRDFARNRAVSKARRDEMLHQGERLLRIVVRGACVK